MPRSRSGSLDSLGRRRRRNTSSYSHRHRRSVSISRSRSRSRSVSRNRRSDRRDSRSRSHRRRSYSRSRSPVIQYHKRRSDIEREAKVEPQDKPNAMSHLSEEEQMRLLLGFGDFDSTKGKVVQENLKGPAIGTSRQDTKREYRQYMNRRGGFNRPLDKV